MTDKAPRLTDRSDAVFDELHHQIKRGDLVSVRQALDAGTSPNTKNRFGWTLLMLAAIEGNTAIGEMLIAHGAQVNQITSMGPGQSALSLAIVSGHARFLKLLLEHGANPDVGGNVDAWLPTCRLPPKMEAEILEVLKRFRTQRPV